MEIDFIPLDYSSFEFEQESYVKVIGKTSSGKRVCLIDKFEIYFWAILKQNVKEKDVKKIIEKIKKISINSSSRSSGILSVKVEEKNFLGKKIKALKIQIPNYKDTIKIAEKLPHKYIENIREHDLNYITKYIICKKIIPGNWYSIDGELLEEEDFGGFSKDLDVDFCFKNVKVKKVESEKKFVPKILAFDIETDKFEIGKGEILMISLVSEDFKKVLTWKKQNIKAEDVENYENEKEMLEAFSDYVKKISPDILTGYYSDGFDLPYLKERAEKNKVKLELGIDFSSPKFSGGMNPRGKIFGRVHIDIFQFIQTAYSQYLQSETLGLNDVANELLGEGKIEHEFKSSENMKKEDWKRFFEYNLQDSILTYSLFMKSWPDILEFSRVIQEPIFEISRNGMAANVDNYIIHNLEKYNEIAEKKPTHEMISYRRKREKYEGAFVLQPVPKLYENVVMFDFTSYWPSIIATFNLSYSTFLEKKQSNSKEIDLGQGNKVYFSKIQGFFPEMLKEIILLRKKFKKEYQKSPSPILKARSNAFKLLANASYGYQGFFGARYYCPEASAATTAISREYMKKLIEDSKKSGFFPIYSDTDSIAIELKDKTHSEALNFLKKINSELPGIMELELEDFYKRGIWVTTREGKFGAKKKYALINEKGKLKIRGFETVRRDWCNLARNLQNKVLHKILEDGNEKSAIEIVKKIIKKIKDRDVEKKELLIKTQLKKSLSEYKAVTPHVTIARKMLAQNLPVNQGMLIEYYIAEGDKKSLTRDRAVFPQDDKPYDIEYYLKKQILPSVENIFQVFKIDIGEMLEKENQKKLF
jgi:DNA polymerase elongation subunit (family B)